MSEYLSSESYESYERYSSSNFEIATDYDLMTLMTHGGAQGLLSDSAKELFYK